MPSPEEMIENTTSMRSRELPPEFNKRNI